MNEIGPVIIQLQELHDKFQEGPINEIIAFLLANLDPSNIILFSIIKSELTSIINFLPNEPETSKLEKIFVAKVQPLIDCLEKIRCNPEAWQIFLSMYLLQKYTSTSRLKSLTR